MASGQRSAKRHHVRQRGLLAGEGRLILTAPRMVGVRIGDGADEQLCVGMLRVLHHFLHAAGFRYLTAVEHDDVVADLEGGRQSCVM